MKRNNNFNDNKPKARNKKPRTEKPVVKSFKKVFDNFEDGIRELQVMYPLFNEILHFSEDEDITTDEASNRMVDAFCNNFPSVYLNQFWSINVSSNRCTLKTNKRIAFGWKFSYHKVVSTEYPDTDVELKDIEFIINIFGDNEILEDIIKDYQWDDVTK